MGGIIIVTRQEALQQLQQKYGRNIPVSELQKLPPRTRPTPRPPRSTPLSQPTKSYPELKQESVRARHQYERPTPTKKPVTERDVVTYKRQMKLIKAKMRNEKPGAKYEIEGKTYTRKQIEQKLGQTETDLNRYLEQREEIRKLHFNPDTGEPIWNEIPLKERKYYPGAEEYFNTFTSDQRAEILGKDQIISAAQDYGKDSITFGILQSSIPHFTEKVNRVLRDMGAISEFEDSTLEIPKAPSWKDLLRATQQVLWNELTQIDPTDKWFSRIHPAEQAAASFVQSARRAVIGIATFPVDIAEKISGQKVPYISDIKKKYEEWEQKQFVGIPGPTSYTMIKTFGTEEEKDWLAEQEKKYGWLMFPATLGEATGYYVGAKIPGVAYKGIKGAISKTGKYVIPKIPKVTAKLPSSIQKQFDKIYGTKTWKHATKWSEGYKPGYDIPLTKTKYIYGEGPSGISYMDKGWEVTKAGKVKTHKGFGKRTFLSPEEVAKFEAKFKPAKRLKPAVKKQFTKIGRYNAPDFKVIELAEYEKFWKPKSRFGYKTVKFEDAFIRAEKEMFVGKPLPPERQLLAPKQKITPVKIERKGLGGYIKKPTVKMETIEGWKLTPEEIFGDNFVMRELKPTRFKITKYKTPKIERPLTERQFAKKFKSEITKDVYKEQLLREGYTYIEDTGKITKGPLYLDSALGKDFIMYEPKLEFIIKEPKQTFFVKGVKKGKIPYSPEQFPQLYGKEWGEKTVYSGFKTKVKYTPKPIVKDISAMQKLEFKPELSKTRYGAPGIKKAIRTEQLKSLGSIKVPASAFKSEINYAKAFETISIPATILSRDTKKIPIQQTDVAKVTVSAQRQRKLLLPETIKVTKYAEETKKVTSLISPLKPLPMVETIKIKTPFPIPIKPKQKRKETIITGYQTFVKTHRKYKPQGKPLRTRQQARGYGALITDTTVSRYFKVKPTSKRGVNRPTMEQEWMTRQHKFKQQNGTFVEQPQFARDTPGEIKGKTPEFKPSKSTFVGWESPSSKHIKRGKEFIYMDKKEMFI